MTKEKYKFTAHDDFTNYLQLIIEHATKYNWRIRRYLKDVEEICLKRLQEYDEEIKKINPEIVMDILSKDDYSEKRHKMRPIPYYLYSETSEKLQFVNLKYLNLIGDNTKGAISYSRFRKAVEKFQENNGSESLGVESLNTDMRQKINSCYRSRNYDAHLYETRFISQINFREQQRLDFKESTGFDLDEIPQNIIFVNKYEYVDVEWIFDVYLTFSKSASIYSTIQQQMRRDYSQLTGNKTEIEVVKNKVMPADFVKISIDSINMN